MLTDLSYRKSLLDLENILEENEREANWIIAKLLCIIGIVELFIWILFVLDVFKANMALVTPFMLGSAIVIVGLCSLILLKDGKGHWVKWILLLIVLLTVFGFNVLAGYKYWILLAIPILLSVGYYETRLTLYISIISAILIVIGGFLNTYSAEAVQVMDMNMVSVDHLVSFEGWIYNLIGSDLDKPVILRNSMMLMVFPNILILLLLTMIAIVLIRVGRTVIFQSNLLAIKKMEMERQILDKNSKLMLSQIQPHFLFNTLNVIQYMMDDDPQQAQKTLVKFSKYLRKNIKTIQDKELVSFAEEMDHVKTFIEIEQLRFDNLEVQYDIQDTDFSLPPLSIQPLVENSISHGVRNKENGIVQINTRRENDCHIIEVIDNGVGFDKSIPKEDGRIHVGMNNVQSRIEELIGGTMQVNSEIGKGTVVTISIPVKND